MKIYLGINKKNMVAFLACLIFLVSTGLVACITWKNPGFVAALTPAVALLWFSLTWVVKRLYAVSRHKHPLVYYDDPNPKIDDAYHKGIPIVFKEKEKELLLGAFDTIRYLKITNSSPEDLNQIKQTIKRYMGGFLDEKTSAVVFRILSQAVGNLTSQGKTLDSESLRGLRFLNHVRHVLYGDVLGLEKEALPFYEFIMGVPLYYELLDEKVEK